MATSQTQSLFQKHKGGSKSTRVDRSRRTRELRKSRQTANLSDEDCEQPRTLPHMVKQSNTYIKREPSQTFDLDSKKQKTLETLSAITNMLQSLNDKKLLDQTQTKPT